jgi:type I site-specific restriction endonuclease
MELYPHNKKAYENALCIFQEANKTCIIHPTGTGKAVIIAKFISDHPHKKHLLLAPGTHIFAEVKKHFADQDIACHTYQNIKPPDSTSNLIGFGFIYLDEFHRIGAETWGPPVLEIVKANPTAKILGTTATHVRYLDEQRDMAFELFEDNIASHISLSRAFADGILRAPVYVNAMYSIEEEFSALAKKIKYSCHDNKKILVSELRKKVVDWNQTSGIDAILKKHLPNTRKRVVVFCSNLAQMKSADTLLMPIMKEIFGQAIPLHIHSRFGDSINKKNLASFREEDITTKILFTRDMMNEGLHGKDISAVILLRETSSPNIFYQQIGRCFSVGQTEQPIIFDLVNNFSNIQLQMFKADFEAEQNYEFGHFNNAVPGIPKETFANKAMIEFIDETIEIRQLFNVFANSIESWEVFFNEAKDFYDQFGHLYVPRRNNPNLHKWIYNQRQAYKESSLALEKISRLTAVGMDWEKSPESSWNRNYNKLKQWVEVHCGDPDSIKDLQVKAWLINQRKKYASGTLTKKERELLSSLVSLEKPREIMWNEKLKLLKTSYEEHGSSIFTKKDPMYNEIKNVRAAFRSRSIPANVLKALQNMQFPLEGRKSWEESFDLVRCYKNEHGCLPTISKDKKLAGWIIHQRTRYGKGKLPVEHIECLRELGILKKETIAFPGNNPIEGAA